MTDELRPVLVTAARAALDSVRWPDGEPYLHMRESMRADLAAAAVDAVLPLVAAWLDERAATYDVFTTAASSVTFGVIRGTLQGHADLLRSGTCKQASEAVRDT